MVQIFMCGVVICLLSGMFYAWSFFAQKTINISFQGMAERIVFGFLTYFIFFQIIALPIVLLKQSLTLLTWIWLGIMIVTVLFAAVNRKVIIGCFYENMKILKNVTMIVMILVVCATVFFAALQSYNGWDTGMYIGGMNQSLSTDTFYFYNGNIGVRQENLNLRYALSMFYVHFTVLCRVFHIEARIMMFYCARALCVMLSSMIVYLFGKKLFLQEMEKAVWMVLVWMVFNWFATALHTSAYFLFVRGYEAKGYCANVILPLLLYGIYSILQKDIKENWKKVALVAFASVPISMSSLAIVPMAIGIMGLVLMIKEKRVLSVINKCFLCVLPNLCYLFIYVLYDKGYFVVGV